MAAASTGDASSADRGRQFQISVQRPVYNQDDFDAKFGWVSAERGVCEATKRAARALGRRCGSRDWWRASLVGFLPILTWLPNYRIRKDLVYDIIAGLTVGIMHIPQGMAYAGLAGLEPVYGLYTSFFPSLFYMFFGTSKHVSLGVFAVVSLMVGSTRYRLVPEDILEDLRTVPSSQLVTWQNESGWDTPLDLTASTLSTTISPVPSSTTASPLGSITPVQVVTTLSLAVGIIQLVMGVCHLGFMSAYLSDQVVGGFTTAGAVHVLVAQINKLIGVSLPRHSGPGKLLRTVYDLALLVPHSNLAPVIGSCVCIFSLAFCKEVLNPRIKKKSPVPVPFELILVILATTISHFAHLEYEFKVKVVQAIPQGLPVPSVPRFDLLSVVLSDAFGIAIVVFGVTVSMGKMFAKKHGYKLDPNQELYALGMMEGLCSMFACYPSSTALARSMVYEQAGVRSQLATIFSSCLLLLVLLWLGPLFHSLPMFVLSSIIVVALKGMFLQFRDLRSLWHKSKLDLSVWLVAFVTTVVIDVREGLLISVAYALVTVVFRSQWPPRHLLGRIPGTDIYRDIKRYSSAGEVEQMKIFRFDSPLIFVNTEMFREAFFNSTQIDLEDAHKWLWGQQTDHKGSKGAGEENQPLAETQSVTPPGCPAVVVLDCSSFNYIDSMGVNALVEIFTDLKSIRVELYFAACKAPMRDILEVSDFYSKVPKGFLFLSLEDAVVSAQQLLIERKEKYLMG